MDDTVLILRSLDPVTFVRPACLPAGADRAKEDGRWRDRPTLHSSLGMYVLAGQILLTAIPNFLYACMHVWMHGPVGCMQAPVDDDNVGVAMARDSHYATLEKAVSFPGVVDSFHSFSSRCRGTRGSGGGCCSSADEE